MHSRVYMSCMFTLQIFQYSILKQLREHVRNMGLIADFKNASKLGIIWLHLNFAVMICKANCFKMKL